jgi:hypothetical protein
MLLLRCRDRCENQRATDDCEAAMVRYMHASIIGAGHDNGFELSEMSVVLQGMPGGYGPTFLMSIPGLPI